MSDPTAQGGWFPDPYGRYEYRWFNGTGWTNDVSRGGQRFVDTGTDPTHGTGSSRGRHSSSPHAPRGVAALVVGLVAAVTAWMPFLVAVGLVAAVTALVLGLRSVRASRAAGTSASGFAVAGLVLSALSLALSGVGIWLSTVVWVEVRTFLEPGPNEVTILDCTIEGTLATATGAVHNFSSETRGYTVTVEFRRDGLVVGSSTPEVDDVAPGENGTFDVTDFVTGSGDVACSVAGVWGPFPFGLEINPPRSP